jgi:membrane associated rhomboid family serine protease
LPKERSFLTGRPFAAVAVIFAGWLAFDVWRFASQWISHQHLRGIPSTAHIAGFMVGMATGCVRRWLGAASTRSPAGRG